VLPEAIFPRVTVKWNGSFSSPKFGWLTPQQVILSVAKDLDPGAPGRRFFAT